MGYWIQLGNDERDYQHRLWAEDLDSSVRLAKFYSLAVPVTAVIDGKDILRCRWVNGLYKIGCDQAYDRAPLAEFYDLSVFFDEDDMRIRQCALANMLVHTFEHLTSVDGIQSTMSDLSGIQDGVDKIWAEADRVRAQIPEAEEWWKPVESYISDADGLFLQYWLEFLALGMTTGLTAKSQGMVDYHIELATIDAKRSAKAGKFGNRGFDEPPNGDDDVRKSNDARPGKIQRVSSLTGVRHEREMDVSVNEVGAWRWLWHHKDPSAPKIEDAFPHLSPADREFILSGITSEEWALDEINAQRIDQGLPPISDLREMGAEFLKAHYGIEVSDD